jgi:hypothetical protein
LTKLSIGDGFHESAPPQWAGSSFHMRNNTESLSVGNNEYRAWRVPNSLNVKVHFPM